MGSGTILRISDGLDDFVDRWISCSSTSQFTGSNAALPSRVSHSPFHRIVYRHPSEALDLAGLQLISPLKGHEMAQEQTNTQSGDLITRERLIELLNEDLAREYQAIIAYTVYSQVITGAKYMTIAAELEVHAGEELAHALMISKLIDYLGGMPTTIPREVKTSDKAEDMLRFDLDSEVETIQNYRIRVRQCEALQEYAMAEQIREILVQEQEHMIDLATALGIDIPDVSKTK